MYDAFNVRSDCALCRFGLAVLGLTALLLVSFGAVAQSMCKEYSTDGGVHWRTSAAAASEDFKAQLDASCNPGPCQCASVGVYPRNNPVHTLELSGSAPTYTGSRFRIDWEPDGGGSGTQYCSVSFLSRDAECPAAPPCSGLASEGVGDQFTSSHFPGSDGYCNAVSHCKMKVTSSVGVDGATLYTIKHTSEQCAHGSMPPPVGDEAKDGETCGGANPEFCLQNSGENCGYLNDSFVCLPKVGETKCAVAADGGRVCGNRAPTPPVPDNGTAGTAATPAATVSSTVNNITTTLNYFSATQVAGSSRDPGSSGDNPYDDEGGDGGSCDPATEECGEGGVTGGEFCSAEPVCTGDAIQCAIVEQQWRNRCVAPLTEVEKTAMFAGLPNDDIDGDGASEGIAEGMPGSSDEPIDILSDFDSDGWLGGRSCPAIYNVDLPAAFGGVINISLADACFFFQLIGSIVLVMAWFEAAKIVVTGFF